MDDETRSKISTKARELNTHIRENSFIIERNYVKAGAVSTLQINMRKSKHLIDEIDTLMGPHFGFSPNEIDFIMNYDIRYRLSDEEDGH